LNFKIKNQSKNLKKIKYFEDLERKKKRNSLIWNILFELLLKTQNKNISRIDNIYLIRPLFFIKKMYQKRMKERKCVCQLSRMHFE
jgi:hypothetical protein